MTKRERYFTGIMTTSAMLQDCGGPPIMGGANACVEGVFTSPYTIGPKTQTLSNISTLSMCRLFVALICRPPTHINNPPENSQHTLLYPHVHINLVNTNIKINSHC